MVNTTLTISVDLEKKNQVIGILEKNNKSLRSLKLGRLINENFDKIILENNPEVK
jgi:hypothetical protein